MLLLLAAAAVFSMPVRAQGNLAALRAPAAGVQPQWGPSFDAFSAADKIRMPADGGVMSAGRSSIRPRENLEQEFTAAPVMVNRGSGGSRMSDCTAHLARLVLPYKPRLVIVCAGENDLAEGSDPAQVLRNCTAFLVGVRAARPQARLAYVMVKTYVDGLDNAPHIDVVTPMLTEQGTPRPGLLGADQLHMNDNGDRQWHAAIAPALALKQACRISGIGRRFGGRAIEHMPTEVA